MTIRFRLTLLTLSALLPAFVAAAIALWFAYTGQASSQAALPVTAAIVLALVAALALARRHARGILDPLARLREDAGRLGGAEPVTPLGSGIEELDLINAALVRASSAQRNASADLERRAAAAAAPPSPIGRADDIETPLLDAVVLFVEDDRQVRDAVQPALEAAGATVLCAASSDEALGVLESGLRVDAVFSSLVMLAEYVQRHHPRTALVLASANADADEHHADAPEMRLLAKPYAGGDAVAVLAQALRATAE